MYKSRIFVWFVVAVLFVFFTSSVNVYNDGKQASGGFNTVLYGCDNQVLSRAIESKKLKGGAKLICNQRNWNVYLSENNPLEGYSYEEYYSPIIAIYDSYLTNSYIVNQNSIGMNTIRSVDFETLLNGFVNEKRFMDIWPNSKGCSYMKETIKICADSNYEDEIRQTILMTLAETSEPTIEDYETYKDKIDEIWNKFEKVKDVESFFSTHDNYILLAPEYVLSLSSQCYSVSISPTVGVEFYLNYKEGYEMIAANDKLMKHSCLRRVSYVGAYRKGHMHSTDWTTIVVNLNGDIIGREISEDASTQGISVSVETSEKQSSQEIESNEKEMSKELNNISEESSKNDGVIASEDSSEATWDINKPKGEQTNADRDIDPNAYSKAISEGKAKKNLVLNTFVLIYGIIVAIIVIYRIKEAFRRY